MLPPELWECVFLHLTPNKILKFRGVNCSFRDIINGSPEVQYIIDLWAAGFEVEYQGPSIALADRRERLDRYRSHWGSLQWAEHTSIPLPFYKTRVVTGGVICLTLLAALEYPTTDYRFIQLPSVLRGIPLKEWTVHGLPNNTQALGLFPEEDLLIVHLVVDRGRSFMIKLLQMSDGQPHPSVSGPLVDMPYYERDWTWRANDIKIQATCSRLALTVPIFVRSGAPRAPHFIVWDWKTGVKYVDILRRSLTTQFIDECRIFGVSNEMGPNWRWSVILLDTAAPVGNPQKPRETEFGLDDTESVEFLYLKEGTYARGARTGSLFRTDRRRHVLGIVLTSSPDPPSFAIDYESICSVASENETTSYIPWDRWKHKTMTSDRHMEFTAATEFTGPRKLVISEMPHPWVLSLWSVDFTPGARRYTRRVDTSLDDASRYAIRRRKLTDMFSESHLVGWALSEDNVLAFTGLRPDERQVLVMWTF